MQRLRSATCPTCQVLVLAITQHSGKDKQVTDKTGNETLAIEKDTTIQQPNCQCRSRDPDRWGDAAYHAPTPRSRPRTLFGQSTVYVSGRVPLCLPTRYGCTRVLRAHLGTGRGWASKLRHCLLLPPGARAQIWGKSKPSAGRFACYKRSAPYQGARIQGIVCAAAARNKCLVVLCLPSLRFASSLLLAFAPPARFNDWGGHRQYVQDLHCSILAGDRRQSMSWPSHSHSPQPDNLTDRADLLQRNAFQGRAALDGRAESPCSPHPSRMRWLHIQTHTGRRGRRDQSVCLFAVGPLSMLPHLTNCVSSSTGSQCQAFPAFWVCDRGSHHRHRSIIDGPTPIPNESPILSSCIRLRWR